MKAKTLNQVCRIKKKIYVLKYYMANEVQQYCLPIGPLPPPGHVSAGLCVRLSCFSNEIIWCHAVQAGAAFRSVWLDYDECECVFERDIRRMRERKTEKEKDGVSCNVFCCQYSCFFLSNTTADTLIKEWERESLDVGYGASQPGNMMTNLPTFQKQLGIHTVTFFCLLQTTQAYVIH